VGAAKKAATSSEVGQEALARVARGGAFNSDPGAIWAQRAGFHRPLAEVDRRESERVRARSAFAEECEPGAAGEFRVFRSADVVA
jgi:hypothetical protein